MGKRKKTYKEKIIADLRRKVYGLEGQNSFSLQTKETKPMRNIPIHNTVLTTTINPHPYLTKDILKTGILTGIILLVQLILFLVLKNHILILPMVKY